MSEKEHEPQEPVLFHGTTLNRYQQFLQSDGSYKNPSGDVLWLDEGNFTPIKRADEDSKSQNSDAMLLLIKTDQIKTRRAISPREKDKFWIASELPPKSFVAYNLTQDTLHLRPKGEIIDVKKYIETLQEICKPLDVRPTILDVFLK